MEEEFEDEAIVTARASSAECDSHTSGPKRVDGRGGRREDGLGNALGGRPNKNPRIVVPPGQLGVFAFFGGPFRAKLS